MFCTDLNRFKVSFSLIIGLIFFLLCEKISAQESDIKALEIIEKSEDKLRGDASEGEMTMTIVRPGWSREMSLKTWSKGDSLALVLLTGPARDKGIAYLKRKRELWNWQPAIDRVIKLPPSMMMQSWMGSDFTNDDLVKESSSIKDYRHKLIGDSIIDGRECHKLELIPKEDAPVVWGKLLVWIDKKDYLQLRVEFFDEDGYLVNTMYGSNIKDLGGRLLPSKLTMIPADKDGHQTIIEHKNLVFNPKYEDNFFSVQNMKRIR